MGDMERLTKKNSAGGYELLEGVAPETAVERLAGYEDAHQFLLRELEKAEAKLESMRGQGKGRSVAFQQALAEKLYLGTLVERLEKPPKG